MKTVSRRTIITSKATGRRYYLVRSSNRSSARRYYVCSRPDCESRLVRESDLFCRAHSQGKSSEEAHTVEISTKSDDGEEILNDNSGIVDEETSPKVRIY
jgi:hypothetical protein